ncbi:antitoxin Xre-like helix-turn-helix domain-containing protein [Agriterribacter sp.]|uniref:type II RES/Xre toxin-antitoxin system antitoxin n=1 Tax=Agriterribacter sp. TaxID=2821509 RepID=UPI002C8C64E2|nr:antitoxin Xre-like helix-turn-helix domain-containing protein [Agriterribacter sp.]HRP54974.1 DUF2384 domain-containing protein [Agriterribacter sp.]
MTVNLGQKSKNMPASKKYTVEDPPLNILEDPAVAYAAAVPSSAFLNLVQRVLHLLGITGQSTPSAIRNNADFIGIIREGVPKKSLDHLMDNTGLTVSEISAIIRTSDRTLRRYTARQKLNPEQSERIIELARLYSRGEEVFGSMDAFKQWMNSTVVALGNKKPKTYLDTSLGITLLMNELGKIEHGIFA